MRVQWIRLWGAFSVAVALCGTTGCAYRGVPAHGGGKRFYNEQEVVAVATREAVGQLDWSKLKNQTVNVFIACMGDEGGGVDNEGGLDIAGVLGFGRGEQRGKTAVGAGAAASYSTDSWYGAYAFANARDVEYLRSVIVEHVFLNGGAVARRDSDISGDLYVVVDTFGTNKWVFDFLIYKEVNLSAQVRLSAYYVPHGAPVETLGRAAQRFKYMENYLFTKIPLNMPGEIKKESLPPDPY